MIDFSRLKDIREDNDISQEKMAEILEVNRSTYSLWELGINIIPLHQLSKFADYFNISLDYVLNLNNNRNNHNLVKGLNIKNIGQNIKSIRIKNHITQSELANMLGITQPAITRIEKGMVNISLPTLYTFCKKFNISLTDICNKKVSNKKGVSIRL